MGADEAPLGSQQATNSPLSAPPPRNKGGGGKKGARKPIKLLKDMRWVWENPTAKPTTESRQMCRDVLDKDKLAFLNALKDLEKAHAARRSAPVSVTSASGQPSGLQSSGFVSTPENEPKHHKMIDLIAEVQRRMEPYSVKPGEGK